MNQEDRIKELERIVAEQQKHIDTHGSIAMEGTGMLDLLEEEVKKIRKDLKLQQKAIDNINFVADMRALKISGIFHKLEPIEDQVKRGFKLKTIDEGLSYEGRHKCGNEKCNDYKVPKEHTFCGLCGDSIIESRIIRDEIGD